MTSGLPERNAGLVWCQGFKFSTLRTRERELRSREPPPRCGESVPTFAWVVCPQRGV
jgi:hypothetical protein